LVEDFLVVVVDFLAGAFVVDFLVVDAVDDVLVVVMDSFLLAHDVIKPKAARTAMDVISDCFIGGWLTSVQNVQPA
jgi:ribosomal protein S2